MAAPILETLDSLHQPAITLRPVALSESRLIWQWRNDEEARRWSLRLDAVPWAAHYAWMYARVARPHWWIGLVDDQPVGVIRFEAQDRCWVSIQIAPDQQNRGYGRGLLRAGVDACGVRPVWAQIHRLNEPSRRIFAAVGFYEDLEDPETVLAPWERWRYGVD